uniref:Uncharacterized protein n=1 Tax=Anopheles coluzzii TaxID=1518534 RepID=A0A8W7PQG4_ANOCL
MMVVRTIRIDTVAPVHRRASARIVAVPGWYDYIVVQVATIATEIVLQNAAATLALLQVLPLDATWTATTEGRLQREVDVLLRIQTDDERRNVHDLLADTLEHLGLQTALKEILNSQAEHVIELHAGLIQHTDANQTTQQGVT